MQGKKRQSKKAHSKLALARLSKLAALALLGPKKGCALAHDFGIFCARAHFRKSQNLPIEFAKREGSRREGPMREDTKQEDVRQEGTKGEGAKGEGATQEGPKQ